MEIFKEIITSIVVTLTGTMITLAGSFLTKWLSTKIKNEKARNALEEAAEVVMQGVVYVRQTYVEGIKGTTLWDKEAMNNASQKAKDYIKENLSKEAINYINSQGKNLEKWIEEQVEIAVQQSK